MAQAFAEDGYLVVEDFMPAAFCDDLQARAKALVEDFDAEAHATVFSTTSASHARDAYFQESGDKIRFFFRGGGLRRRRPSETAEGAVDQQDRACDA